MKQSKRRARGWLFKAVAPAVMGLLVAGTMAASAQAAPVASAVPDLNAGRPGEKAGHHVADMSTGADVRSSAKILSRCIVVVDLASGARVRSDGDCDVRNGPESTFKIPLALIGFETGILRTASDPSWSYDGRFPAPQRDHKTVNPAIWERDSVVWFSRELVRRMAKRDGDGILAKWLARLDYGNRDARGDPGKNNGLTNAWLSSSIKISPNEQTGFLRRMLRGELPVSERALTLTRSIVPVFSADGGWTIHGKTGSTGRRPVTGSAPGWQERGWFIGWAEKDGRSLVFAIHEHTEGGPEELRAGPRLRQ